MAETLKHISAPQLAPSYGANIADTFDNIDKNFGFLGNRDFVKGENGESLLVSAIPTSALFGDTDFTVTIGDKTYTVTSQKSAVITALSAMISGSDAASVTRIVNQLTNNSDRVLCCLGNVVDNGTLTAEIISIWPYVVIDELFNCSQSLDNPDTLSGATDMSCVLYFEYEDVAVPPAWVARRSFPYLYYNDSTGNLQWCINGTSTTIDAQGPGGPAGENASNWIVKVTYDGTSGMFQVDGFLDPSPADPLAPWLDPSYLHDDMNPKTGDVCIVIPSTNVEDSQLGYKYWISSLYTDGDEYEVFCGADNWRWAYLTDKALEDAMKNIGPENVNKGLVIPCINPTNKYYVISVDNTDNLHIGVSGNSTNGACDNSYNNVNSDIASKQIVLDQSVAHAFISNDPYNNLIRQTNSASGMNSHAEGRYTTSSGEGSHSEGNYTESSGVYSHAEGLGNRSIGMGSHAEGEEAKAFEEASHAEGYRTIARGLYSHAEGSGDEDSYDTYGLKPYNPGTPWYFVEGGIEGTLLSEFRGCLEYTDEIRTQRRYIIDFEGDNKIKLNSEFEDFPLDNNYHDVKYYRFGSFGAGSHVEGYNCTALGTGSHAEGKGSFAGGFYSHAEGYYTTASGDYSHAEGNHTIAKFDYEHACGSYNESGYIKESNDASYGVNTYYITDTITGSTGLHTIFSIGAGADNAYGRRNSFFIASDGTPFIWDQNLTNYPRYIPLRYVHKAHDNFNYDNDIPSNNYE